MENLKKKIALIIDDGYNSSWQRHIYSGSDDLDEYEIVAFEYIDEAVEYLNGVTKDKYPDICILDASVSSGFFSSDRDAGFENAIDLDKFFNAQKHKIDKYLFKSADPPLAKDAADKLMSTRPDLCVGLFIKRSYGAKGFSISNVVVPKEQTFLIQEFIAAVARTPDTQLYYALRDQIEQLYHNIDNLDEVKNPDDAEYGEFKFAMGRAKVGVAVFSIDDLKNLLNTEKAVFICDEIPPDILKYSDKLAAIVIRGDSDMPMHLRLILKPYDISLLIGAKDDIDVSSLQYVTIEPSKRRLYNKELEILTVDAQMPMLHSITNTMNRQVDKLLLTEGLFSPRFMVNVSSHEDYGQNISYNNIGLTRTEHFISPFVSPEQWGVMRDFLIGDGVRLREIFNHASSQSDEYNNKFNGLASATLPVINNYCADDVVRLFDIPATEFMSGDELSAFETLYGKNTRGVQLAKQVPDLYIYQLNILSSESIYNVPKILIPAVKTGDDIDFVDECAKVALSEDIYKNIKLGAMVETVEAANNIKEIARKVSFLSIGSNDLTAAVHNASRADQSQAYLFMNLTPEVLNIIEKVVNDARAVNPNIHISLCGEAAANIDSLNALRNEVVKINAFSVPPTLKDAILLPLLYKNDIYREFSRN